MQDAPAAHPNPELLAQAPGPVFARRRLNPNLAYRLVAEAESDSTTQDIWIPLPRSAGPFFVRVLVKVDGTRLDSEDSDPFD